MTRWVYIVYISDIIFLRYHISQVSSLRYCLLRVKYFMYIIYKLIYLLISLINPKITFQRQLFVKIKERRMSEQLNRCKKSLRSILLANKGGIPARQMSKEYQSLYEERIPYKALGFQTLGMYNFFYPNLLLWANVWYFRDVFDVNSWCLCDHHQERRADHRR